MSERNELPQKERKEIERKLSKAARLMQEAVELAQSSGWPEAFGFAEGSGFGRMGMHIIHSFEVRDEQNSSPPSELCVTSNFKPEGWDCGAW